MTTLVDLDDFFSNMTDKAGERLEEMVLYEAPKVWIVLIHTVYNEQQWVYGPFKKESTAQECIDYIEQHYDYDLHDGTFYKPNDLKEYIVQILEVHEPSQFYADFGV